jgi:hypothetical protein
MYRVSSNYVQPFYVFWRSQVQVSTRGTATLSESLIVFLSTYRKERRWYLYLLNIIHIIRRSYFPSIASLIK